jgi:putative transcriptional regulator
MAQKKKSARNPFEADLIASMGEVLGYVKGSRKGLKVHRFRPEDVRLVRAKTKKSQAEFARTYGVGLKALQKWERGEASPTGAAASLLRVIAVNPKAVEKALASS